MSAIVVTERPTGWLEAARLVARWLDRRERIDALMETLPAALKGAERGRCQHLVFGVVRHTGRIEPVLAKLIAHPPRFITRAVLYVAGFELIEAEGEHAEAGQVAKIVHHAVEQTKGLASPAEARLVNAVVRKLAAALHAQLAPNRLAPAAVLGEFYSHPAWLVSRWLAQFGAESTRELLKWNQQPATVFARWRDAENAAPEWMKPTAWARFFEVPTGRWGEVEPLVKRGALYLQDPGTRFAVELLAPQAGETVLDLCAAPGGKSLMIADAMRGAGKVPASGKIVAMDLPLDASKPGPRVDRLKENLARVSGVEVALVQGDVLHGAGKLLRDHEMPEEFAAVLIDVPCSNTGVMRHRVDVKWRLQEGDFSKHARQQLAMLMAAARLVAAEGRLVYSTCSIDTDENEKVVAAFIEQARGRFELVAQRSAVPWKDGHDGAAAFLLRRTAVR